MTGYPRFDELPVIGKDGERHAWDVFGVGDELGCLNFITPAEVAAAAASVVTGEVIDLNLPLTEPQPQFWTARTPLVHHHYARENIRDDSLDSLPLQGSTQWDGFRHQRYRQFGFYGGRQDADLDDRGEIGIEKWAVRGILGRGVLADVAGYLASQGTPMDPEVRLPIGPELLDATLAAQGTKLQQGDILLVRTGWLGWYVGMDPGVRTEMATRLAADKSKANLPGLDPRQETAAWLWDHRVAALAFDTPTLETLPYRKEEGWAHNRLLPLLGLPLGELWKLDGLAEACGRASRHSFFLTSAPLNLPGAAGSPANAYAVF